MLRATAWSLGRHTCLGMAVVAVLAGCAHRTRIITQPPGASVYVAGTLACVTPCVYSTPATELKEHVPLRLEREGYRTIDTELKTGILGSRIFGGLFTLGLVPLFKWPHSYHTVHEFVMTPMTREERLAEADRLYQEGAISRDEYQALRNSVLGVRR